jgi:hypothetical protein
MGLNLECVGKEVQAMWKESISKFQMEMRQRLMDALHNLIWMDEMLKSLY